MIHRISILPIMQERGILNRIVILILLFLVMSNSMAQTNTKGFSYEIGLGYGAGRDDLLIPLAFRGPGVLTGLGYSKPIGRWELELEGRFKFDIVFNRFGHPGAIISYDLKPSLTRRLSNTPYGSIHGGISTPIESNNQFLFSWDDAHLYWLNIRGLNLELANTWSTASGLVMAVELSVPILSFVSRPKPYRYEKQDASLMWLGLYSPDEARKYKNAGFSDYQAYTLQFSRTNTERLVKWSLNLDFDHYEQPRDVWVSSISITRSSKLKFWRGR